MWRRPSPRSCRAVPTVCQRGLGDHENGIQGHSSGPLRSGVAQVAEADGNRTRQRRGAALTSFEDRGGHQAPRRLRVDFTAAAERNQEPERPIRDLTGARPRGPPLAADSATELRQAAAQVRLMMRDRRATSARRARNVGMLAPQRANRDPKLRHFRHCRRGDVIVIVIAVGLVVALAFSMLITAFTTCIINPIRASRVARTGWAWKSVPAILRRSWISARSFPRSSGRRLRLAPPAGYRRRGGLIGSR